MLGPGDAPDILSRACIFTSPITVVYSLGTRVNTCVTVFQKLLSRSGVRGGSEVGGDHGGGQGGGVDGAGVDVQREHAWARLGVATGVTPGNQKEPERRDPRQDESAPVES